MYTHDVFRPGHNCWRVERAGRVAFLVDGEAYFRAFHAAVGLAQRSILIVGWDIDSRTRLVHDDALPDETPVTLFDCLAAAVRRHRRLHAYVLDWDYATLYGLGREWLPIFKMNWSAPRRMHFHLDDHHPFGSSRHQKIVVIDDTVAFVGGLDLTKCRWDTPEHRPDDPRRVGPGGEPYPPFHDVQMMVDGPAAATLGQLVRERWWRATGQRLDAPGDCDGDPWPKFVTPDLTDVDVAIARTEPRYDGQEPVQEIRQLYLDAIAGAHRHIYLENQYLTSEVIGEALATRLSEPDGPEIVLVGPRQTDGWLTQNTMDMLRARLLQRLRRNEHHERLRACYPDVAGLKDTCVNVHAKLAVFDDECLLVGSANLNNRSLAIDSECNLALVARGEERISRAIARLRDRLVAEHLGVRPDDVAGIIAGEGSLIAATRLAGANGHSLREIDDAVPPEIDVLVPCAEIVDPEQPVSFEQLSTQFVPEEEQPSIRRRVIVIVSLVLLLLGMAAAWRWSPLGEWLNVQSITEFADTIPDNAAAPWIVLGAYLLGGLLVVPITLLVIVTVTVFGPLLGSVYALIGTLLSAMLVFGIGHALGRATVRRVAGSYIGRLSRRLARQGILTIVVVRLLPIAPFSVVNLVFGASHIRLRDFLFGTALGMAPGIALIALFIDRIRAALEAPEPMNFLVLAASVAAALLAAFGLYRWLQKRAASVTAEAADES